jgi:alkanesulfonate monooxygenase SsuD/methylene tetrahydromethanopterin reductase-like flavin-dependent oxidoreductase (luciferase family)
LWTQTPATFIGEHYQIEGAYCEPKPDPVPPILVGSPGPKVLRVTARLADGWNWDAPLSVYGPPYDELQRACAEVGRDPATLWLTAGAIVDFPDDPATFQADYAISYYPDQRFPILGPTPADAIAQLQPLVDRGVQHVMIFPETLATLQRFGAEVVPALRAPGEVAATG